MGPGGGRPSVAKSWSGDVGSAVDDELADEGAGTRSLAESRTLIWGQPSRFGRGGGRPRRQDVVILARLDLRAHRFSHSGNHQEGWRHGLIWRDITGSGSPLGIGPGVRLQCPQRNMPRRK